MKQTKNHNKKKHSMRDRYGTLLVNNPLSVWQALLRVEHQSSGNDFNDFHTLLSFFFAFLSCISLFAHYQHGFLLLCRLSARLVLNHGEKEWNKQAPWGERRSLESPHIVSFLFGHIGKGVRREGMGWD